MTVNIDRRRLVVGGALGLGALLLPIGRSLAEAMLAAKGFTHNVASGEPGADSMLLWTRYVPAADVDEVRVDAEVALDPEFTRVVSGGSVRTGEYRDWTVKLTVNGLQPRTTYWYRFIAADGSKSPVGRTRTLPVGAVDRFGLGVFSCSNLPIGWFNAYAHAAARDDLDLWLHVGDYVYEYALAVYGEKHLVAGREVMPAHDHEMISLADYRLRLACYRADPDLQRLHQRAPMVALWDDHDSANDSWEGGAQNHQPKSEGDWSIRRAASIQAYREWMPVSEEPWKAYSIGTLATLYRTESRVFARTRPAYSELSNAHKASDPDAALRAFRDGVWRDPAATMLGSGFDAKEKRGSRRKIQKRKCLCFHLADGRHGNHHGTHLDAGRGTPIWGCAPESGSARRWDAFKEKCAWFQTRRADVDGSLGRLSRRSFAPAEIRSAGGCGSGDAVRR